MQGKMAISVAVPKDLSGIKTKVALNLTKRQIICFSGAALFGVPVYLFTKILYFMVRQKFLTPGIRPYKSENLYKTLEVREQLEKEVRSLEQKAKGKQKRA